MQRRAPAVDFVPVELHGEPIVAVVCCYAGGIEAGEDVLRPLKAFGSPVLDLCRPKPYVAHQTTFDAAFPHGWHYYFRACDVAALSDDVIDTMVEHGERIGSPITSAALWQMGGAVARVGEAASLNYLSSTASVSSNTGCRSASATKASTGASGFARKCRRVLVATAT